MNYRHGFHAGNHADCLKHAALALLLAHLKKKDKGFFVLDTHGGRGRYDLQSVEAIRSGEFRFGIARLLSGAAPPPSLAPYLSAVRQANPGGGLLAYPGSPAIVAQMMRPQDRLVACELNKGEAALLSDALAGQRRARVETRDGYGVLRASLPPPERRGLVLIDPPFEAADEFAVLGKALGQAWRRWPDGQYLVWYPIKSAAAVDAFLADVKQAGLRDAVAYELHVRSPAAGAGMTGSGVLALNASFVLDAAMAEILPFLATRLAQGPGARGEARRITAE